MHDVCALHVQQRTPAVKLIKKLKSTNFLFEKQNGWCEYFPVGDLPDCVCQAGNPT